MTDGAKIVLKRTLQLLERTKSLTTIDAAEAFVKLGISKNIRRGRKSIAAMPVAGPDDMKA